VLEVSNKNGSIGTVFFIIGAMCLYTSFYRTRLIPRWLTLWGMIGAVFYLGYGLLSLFDIGGASLGFLQLPTFVQELAMGLWLVIKGFNLDAVKKLDEAH
jgi:integral membrane sensor domain MASE1